MKLHSSLFALTINQKEIFYFSTEKISSDNPHYFICIKKTATEVLLFTCCTSQGEKRERYIIQKGFPLSTLVYIKPNESLPFTKDTYVDCNTCLSYTLEEFLKLCQEGKMIYKGEIDDIHYEAIIIGLLASPQIDEATKKELPNPE